MVLRTQGLALKITPYAETSIVAQIYTLDYGLQSYLIQGAKNPKSKIPVSILQPFHLLDMVVYHKNNSQLQRIKEARQYPLLRQLPFDILKSSISQFLNEVLYKVLRHQEADAAVFSFVADSIQWLDQTTAKLGNFHLVFLINLSRYLGFYPIQSDKPYLDLAEGIFTNIMPTHAHVLVEPNTSMFRALMQCTYENMSNVALSKQDRRYLLEKTLDLYRLHTENFGEVRSLEILEEIFA
ncbi:DNA repair protein RecO [Sphingobacterium corticis]|uniref:DNA repair protein RecO n=1 Tax=Sphingobacterium corticis TaxID=1812823 RepID=A0ABW5NKQ7_9SPHI